MHQHQSSQDSLVQFVSGLTCKHTAHQREPLAPMCQSLPKAFSVAENEGRSGCCLVMPSLSLRHSQNTPSSSCTSASTLMHIAAKKLSQPLHVRREQLTSLPIILLHNVCSSLQSLLDSRIQATAQALLSQSLNAEFEGLLSKLAESPSGTGLLALSAAEVSFSCHSHDRIQARCSDDTESTDASQLTADISFQGMFKVKLLNKREVTVRVSCPGNVSGTTSGTLLENVYVGIDTSALLDSMIMQCRELVYNALTLMVRGDVSKGHKPNVKKVRVFDGMELLCTAVGTCTQTGLSEGTQPGTRKHGRKAESPSCRSDRKRMKSLTVHKSLA